MVQSFFNELFYNVWGEGQRNTASFVVQTTKAHRKCGRVGLSSRIHRQQNGVKQITHARRPATRQEGTRSKLTVCLKLRSRKTVRFSEQIMSALMSALMSADEYPSTFSSQMKAILYISKIKKNFQQLLNEAEQDTKNSADQGGCYPQTPKAEVDNTLRDLQNSSYPTKAEFNNCFIIHSKYMYFLLLIGVSPSRSLFYALQMTQPCPQVFSQRAALLKSF